MLWRANQILELGYIRHVLLTVFGTILLTARRTERHKIVESFLSEIMMATTLTSFVSSNPSSDCNTTPAVASIGQLSSSGVTGLTLVVGNPDSTMMDTSKVLTQKSFGTRMILSF
jgi:hypothetical protein